MLKNWNKPEKPEAEELEERLEAAKQKLRQQQMLIKDRKLPVFVLFEGWGTAGKGSILGKLILNIDPRFWSLSLTRHFVLRSFSRALILFFCSFWLIWKKNFITR